MGGPKNHVNTRILQTGFVGIPLIGPYTPKLGSSCFCGFLGPEIDKTSHVCFFDIERGQCEQRKLLGLTFFGIKSVGLRQGLGFRVFGLRGECKTSLEVLNPFSVPGALPTSSEPRRL